ncbi:hypothetical protein ACS0TY_004260 [Phlomoides rotata]
METRSSRIQELKEKNELSRMWGLFSILESCQGHPGHKLISNGRPMNNKHIIADYPRKSFDEECQRIQKEAGLRSVPVDARVKTLGNFDAENTPIDEHKSKRSIVKIREHIKMDSELERVVKTQKRERKSRENAYQSSSCCLDNAGCSIHQVPSTSAEVSLNKLTLAAILEAAVCAQNHHEESKLSEYVKRSNHLGKYDNGDEIHIKQVQMRAKAFVDQMFINRKLICNKTVKSILDANFSEREGLDASSSTESRLKMRSMSKNVRQKSDKIVILKPAPRNVKHSGNVTSHCSLLQAHNKSSRRVSDAKTTSFSFREMKRKLKHTFGVSRKEQSLLVGNSEKLSQECICGGVDIRKSVNSSTNSEQKGMKKDLKSNRGSDVACETDDARKKLDISSVALSKKKEFDVILEAKRHLSARLRNINSLEGATSKKSPKTLQRVLSSPEHDFRPLGPDSEQMRFSPQNTSLRATESSSQVLNGMESARFSPLRSNREVTSCDDHDEYDHALHLMEAKTCSPTPRTEEEVHDSDISITDDTKSNGESDILETDIILHPDLHVSEKEQSDVKKCDTTRTTQINDTMKPQKHEEIATHSTTSDSLSENEAITVTGDDSPSPSFSIYKLDMANTIKYHEEHRSPVSVLEPFFVEDTDSPPSTTPQSARKQLQPRRLDFEECSFESIPHDPSISYMEDEDHLMQYVQLVVQASNLNWDQLSQVSYPPEELLHESVFDEVELPPLDCYYDPKLLFDHINELLMEICECHCCSPYWLPLITIPRIMSTPLAEVVLDEIMSEADFYLLPMTEKRTLDQLVSKDVEKCRSWLDVRLDTERIVIDISEDVLVESILDIVLEFTM